MKINQEVEGPDREGRSDGWTQPPLDDPDQEQGCKWYWNDRPVFAYSSPDVPPVQERHEEEYYWNRNPAEGGLEVVGKKTPCTPLASPPKPNFVQVPATPKDAMRREMGPPKLRPLGNKNKGRHPGAGGGYPKPAPPRLCDQFPERPRDPLRPRPYGNLPRKKIPDQGTSSLLPTQGDCSLKLRPIWAL